MMRWFIKKLKSDRGDAILTQSIIAAMVVVLFAAITFDYTKGATIKNDFTAKAQQSAQVSIKTINSSGSMDWKAAESFAKEYESLRGIDRTDTNRQCSTHDFGSGKKAAPYYTFTLKSGRGKNSGDTVSWTTSNPSQGMNSAPKLKNGETYRSINVEVHDASPNLFLDIFGVPCQGVGVNVSAISFGSQSDI